MSKSKQEVMNEVGKMLVGYKTADLTAKMEILCGVTQHLLENGYENLWVSLCLAPDDAVFNVVSGEWDEATLERDTRADAARIGAECVVVANDAWTVPTELMTHPGQDLSEHPARKESIMLVARDRAQHLVGCKPFVGTTDKLVFGELLIEPIANSWLDYPGSAQMIV